MVQTLRALGKDVFLDLKLHDIPNTVRGAARSAASIGAKLLTVHATGGREMIEAAVEGAGSKCGVLGVTILTSIDAAMLRTAWGRKSLEVYGEVLRLAGECAEAGAHGVVCSGLEAQKIGAKYGEKLKQAKDKTERLLDLLNDGDEVYLLRLSDLPAATVDPATHDLSQHVAAAFVGRNDAVADEKCCSTPVVRDDSQ